MVEIPWRGFGTSHSTSLPRYSAPDTVEIFQEVGDIYPDAPWDGNIYLYFPLKVAMFHLM